MAIQAEYKGNFSGGQLGDSSGNKNNLIRYGLVDNPMIVKTTTIFPTAPEGDRWFGGWDFTSQYGDHFTFPDAVILDIVGSVEFYINTKSMPDNFYVYFCEGNGGAYTQQFKIQLANPNALVSWTNGSGGTDYLTIAGNICDGNTHLVKISWDNNTGIMHSYIDGVLDVTVSDMTFNFNISEQPAKTNFFGFTNGNTLIDPIFLDDFIIKDGNGTITAEYKGNSNTGQLHDDSGNGNDAMLLFDAIVNNYNNIDLETALLNKTNSWLGHWVSGEFDGILPMPLSSRPHNAGGSISFYFKSFGDNSINIYSFDTSERDGQLSTINDSFDERYLYIYLNGNVITTNFTDAVLNNIQFDTNQYNFSSGIVHLFELKWVTENSNTNLQVYIDGVLDATYSTKENNFAPMDFGTANKPYGDTSSQVSLGSNVNTEFYLGDFIVKDENDIIIAEWKGNNGVIEDSSGNQNTLLYNTDDGLVKNPGNNLPLVGDKWLASWQGGIQQQDYYNDYLFMPLSSRPMGTSGRISFIFQGHANFNDEDINFDGITFDIYNNSDEEWIYIGSGDMVSGSFGLFTKNIETNFNSELTIYDGNPHEIWITWDNTKRGGNGVVTIYVDGILDLLYRNATISLGNESYTGIDEDGIGANAYVPLNSEAFVGNLIISNKFEKPNDEIDEQAITAWWKGY